MNKITELAIQSLANTYKLFLKLGESGKENVSRNQFGDSAMRMDIESEKTIFTTLKKNNLKFKMISEELEFSQTSQESELLVICDGLDGSGVYKEKRLSGRYGTLLGIFSNTNPSYDDFIFSGCMEHPSGILYFANNSGAWKLDLKKYDLETAITKKIKLSTMTKKSISRSDPIYIDEYFEINKKTFSQKLQGFNTKCLGSSASYYTALADGKAQFVLECTRKNNLEHACVYGLITKSGGIFCDINGNKIGNQKYLKFGQKETINTIAAANKMLLDEILKKL